MQHSLPTVVFPPKAGIQRSVRWIPAFAGMTDRVSSYLRDFRLAARYRPISSCASFGGVRSFGDGNLGIRKVRKRQTTGQPGPDLADPADSLPMKSIWASFLAALDQNCEVEFVQRFSVRHRRSFTIEKGFRILPRCLPGREEA